MAVAPRGRLVVVAMAGQAAFTAERAFDQMLQFMSCRGDGLIDAGLLARHRDRRPAADTDLHDAFGILAAFLVATFIGEMDFDSGDAGGESLQSGLDMSLNVMGEFLAAIDVAVGADVDLHLVSIFLLLSGR